MLKSRALCCSALAALAVALLAPRTNAQLNLEGQLGILFNPVPYTLQNGKFQVGAAFVDADHLGSVKSYSLLYGIKGYADVGYTRINTNIAGVKDQNILNAKWQFLNDHQYNTAASLWILYRDLVNGTDDLTVGVNTAKVFFISGMPLMMDVGVRSGKAIDAGLFGIGSQRVITWESSVTLSVLPTVVLMTEWRQQIDARMWTDFGVRWDFNPHWDVSVALANLAPGLNHQFGVGLCWKP